MSSSGATPSPSDSVIAGDFGAMSSEEQERQRQEWKAELAKTEEEMATLRQVLAAKEAHAAGLKRRLGITAWREFSEDMSQGIKSIQDSAAYKKTAEGLTAAKEKTTNMWSQVTHSQGFQNVSDKVGSVFGVAKTKISASMATHQEGAVIQPAGTVVTAEAAEEQKKVADDETKGEPKK